jgi:hypothetical protein
MFGGSFRSAFFYIPTSIWSWNNMMTFICHKIIILNSTHNIK